MAKRKLKASRWVAGVCALWIGWMGAAAPMARAQQAETREIELSVLEDKVRGGWAGQMVGVTYGAPTEFRWLGKMVEGEIKWTPEMVKGALRQDDLYVEMTFTDVIDRYGLDATTEQYGEGFRDSKYNLWHANAAARRLLNNGIKAPWSGHPKYNMHANDIDFQIEADFIGLMTPGMRQKAIDLCDRVGRVMNYGDGVYGGMFVTGMYSAAYFENDVAKVVQAGLECMPKGSGYRAIIQDVIETHKKYPGDWRQCWRVINEKWDMHDSCPDGALRPFNIDARLNGAYIAIGMLYGAGDFDRTLEISTRCGQDSDCNPASAAGILGVMHGYKALDQKWVGAIPDMAGEKFSYTNYTFNDVVDATLKRAIEIARLSGGGVKDGRLIVPIQQPVPPELEQWSMGIPKKAFAFDDAAWVWTGPWTDQKGEAYFRPASKVSSGGGAEATLEFSGTAIGVMGYMTGEGGMAEVYLDGKKVGEINAYIVERTTDDNLWHMDGLTDGAHTLRIVTLDKADPRSTGKRIAIHRAVSFGPEK